MITKKYRTPKEQIPFILKKGDQAQTALFIVRYTKNNEHFSRFRVIISKKLESKAIRRNKLRRQTYEAIRLQIAEKTTKSTDYILIPKKKILRATYQDIAQDLKKWIN